MPRLAGRELRDTGEGGVGVGCRSPYRQQDDAGGLHGVLGRQHNPPVVNAAVEVRVGRPAHGKVPLEEVVLQGAMALATEQVKDV